MDGWRANVEAVVAAFVPVAAFDVAFALIDHLAVVGMGTPVDLVVVQKARLVIADY